MVEILKNLHRDESAQDLIEYALLGVLVAISAVVVLPTVASDVSIYFSRRLPR